MSWIPTDHMFQILLCSHPMMAEVVLIKSWLDVGRDWCDQNTEPIWHHWTVVDSGGHQTWNLFKWGALQYLLQLSSGRPSHHQNYTSDRDCVKMRRFVLLLLLPCYSSQANTKSRSALLAGECPVWSSYYSSTHRDWRCLHSRCWPREGFNYRNF